MNRFISHMTALVFILLPVLGKAQIYTGVEGLLQVPSAELSLANSMRLGTHYVNSDFVPNGYSMDSPTAFYVSLTPYRWVEASYMILMWKKEGTYLPDRSLSVKLQPLKEGKWRPALVVGGFDIWGTSLNKNFYAATVKHFEGFGGKWGLNVAYRHYFKEASADKWNGFVGGLTFRPNFYRDLRATAEYDGCEFNIGIDAKFKVVRVQFILQDWKQVSVGLCLELNDL